MPCRHGVECTETECLYSCGHWSSISPPSKVHEIFLENMWRCYKDNLSIIEHSLDIRYGDGNQQIDIWGNESKCDKAAALFHGGYWQEGDRKLFTSAVKPLVENGFVVACIGYDLATVKPLHVVSEEAVNALRFLQKRWTGKKICVIGHSAGAQLALKGLHGLKEKHHFNKVLLFSGIYDLSKLPGTYIGNAINLNPEEAALCSVTNLKEYHGNLKAIVGGDESPVFLKETQQIVEIYKKGKKKASQKVIPSEDHFSLISNLAIPKSPQMVEMIEFLM